MDWATITAVLTLLVGGGGFLFYSQRKAAMEIANASSLATEWEKLYREQKAEREENDTEVAQLRDEVINLKAEVVSRRHREEEKDNEVAKLRDEVANLRAEVASRSSYICYNIACTNRTATNKQSKTTEK